MPLIKKVILPVSIIILTVYLLNTFRVVPVTKLFNGYDVLYASTQVSSAEVAKVLESSGCSNFIYLDNQRIPLGISENTPEAALAQSGLEKSTYLKDRINFFFDRNRNYSIFYIQEEQEKNAVQAVHTLNEAGISAGINGSASFPFVAIIIVLGFSAFLIYFSKKRLFLSALFVIPVYFSIMIPFYSIAVSLCVFELAVSLAVRLEGRAGAQKKLLSNVMFCSFISVAFAAAMLSKVQAGILFVMMVCSELCIMLLSDSIKEYFDSKYSFRPVKILSANVIPVLTRKNAVTLGVCAAACVLIFASALFSSSIQLTGTSGGGKNIQLPSSKGVSGNFPDMNSFISWKWETMTYPYRSLNGLNGSDDTVFFKSYNMKDGVITETTNSISFDDNFRKNASKDIQELNYPAIEKVIASQEKKARFGYASSGTQNLSVLMLILMLVTASVPFAFYLNTKRWR